MKDRFTKTELNTRIFFKDGEGKNKPLLVEKMLKIQDSSEDGRMEFEGKQGIYVFEKKDGRITFKLPNGLVIRKKIEQ